MARDPKRPGQRMFSETEARLAGGVPYDPNRTRAGINKRQAMQEAMSTEHPLGFKRGRSVVKTGRRKRKKGDPRMEAMKTALAQRTGKAY